jgi:hypothetical protein
VFPKFQLEIRTGTAWIFSESTPTSISFVFDIYRKPTDAPLYIPNDSHHPMSHKLAAFQSALFRMWAVPLSDRRREKELDYILHMATINGYKKETILKLNEKHQRKWRWKQFSTLKPIKEKKKKKTFDKNGRETTKNIVLPFVRFKHGKLENTLRRQALNVCFNSRGNLKELVEGVKKGRPKRERSGIYRIRCKRKKCKKLYLGQTKRRMGSRENEHDRAIRKSQPEKSAVAAHCLTNQHES